MKVLDLFSGIGGFALGFHMADPKFQTVGFVEQDEYCQKILALRFPEVFIYNDIKTFDPAQFIGTDIICGGFPCQPWSQAGRQQGVNDDRDLWHEMLRVIKVVKPRFVVGENVRGFINEPLGLQRSISDLENIGYENQAFIIPALAVDAKHRRDRCWIISVANTKSERHRRGNSQKCGVSERIIQPKKQTGGALGGEAEGCSQPRRKVVANTNGTRSKAGLSRQNERQKGNSREFDNGSNQQSRWSESYRWPDEPNIPRISHGVPNRVDRLKCIGNSIIPAIAMHIGRAIIEASR